MKQLLYCVILLVFAGTGVGSAAQSGTISSPTAFQSILPSTPGLNSRNVEQFVPKNLIDLERIVNPKMPEYPAMPTPESYVRVSIVAEGSNQKMLTMQSQTWDTTSSSWFTQYAQTNTYNASADMTESIWQYSYVVGVPLTNQSRSTYVYDANHMPTEVIWYSWTANAWAPTSRIVLTYDVSHRPISSTNYTRVANAWSVAGQTLYSYSTSTSPSEYLYQSWTSGAWVNMYKYSYTYTASNDPIDYYYYNWVSNAWSGQSHVHYTYDANGHMTSYLSQYGVVGVWTNQSLATYTNDANGNNTEIVYQNWNSSAWVNSGRNVTTFDASNRPTSYTYYNWVSDAWVVDGRSLYTYDSHGWIIQITTQMYGGGYWVDSYKSMYEYDANGNYTVVQSQRYNGSAWVNDSRSLFTWLGGTAGVNEEPALAAGYKLSANYPNPFNPSTKISYTLGKVGQVTLTVFDMLGREIATLVNEQQTPGEHVISWNANSASSGLYYYRLNAGGFTLAKSMMLVK